MCFNARQATGGSSTGGYVDQCYHDVSWNGYENEVVAGATAVTVAASATTSGDKRDVSFERSDHRHRNGHESDPSPTSRWKSTTSGGLARFSFTGSDGTYSVSGLALGHRRRLLPRQLHLWRLLHKRLPGPVLQRRQLGRVPLADLSGATGVTVTAGSTESGINAALAAAPTAAISGTVAQARRPDP